jgi:hypothetical protein
VGDLVDLTAARAELAPGEPDVVLTVRLRRLGDGTVAYGAECVAWAVDGVPVVSDGWIRANLRWALLAYARKWRMGLMRRPVRPRKGGGREG